LKHVDFQQFADFARKIRFPSPAPSFPALRAQARQNLLSINSFPLPHIRVNPVDPWLK
jgi:hypothetical protein